MRQELAKKIEDVFANTPYPGDNSLGRDWEIEPFVGKHWKTIPLNVVMSRREELLSFSPAGFRFYLPAYLIAALVHPEETVDTLPNNILWSLAPPGSEDTYLQSLKSLLQSNRFDQGEKKNIELTIKDVSEDPDWRMKKFLNRVNIFSPEEKTVISTFILSFKELFPLASWSDMDSARERLERAIAFWSEVDE
jgi:hypothetical protein